MTYHPTKMRMKIRSVRHVKKFYQMFPFWLKRLSFPFFVTAWNLNPHQKWSHILMTSFVFPKICSLRLSSLNQKVSPWPETGTLRCVTINCDDVMRDVTLKSPDGEVAWLTIQRVAFPQWGFSIVYLFINCFIVREYFIFIT